MPDLIVEYYVTDSVDNLSDHVHVHVFYHYLFCIISKVILLDCQDMIGPRQMLNQYYNIKQY